MKGATGRPPLSFFFFLRPQVWRPDGGDDTGPEGNKTRLNPAIELHRKARRLCLALTDTVSFIPLTAGLPGQPTATHGLVSAQSNVARPDAMFTSVLV